jgi:site-specific recombinase XerD
MSVRNLKDGKPKSWLCECYPQGRTGKRIRKRFATKGEAITFERFTMKEVDDKPWLGDKPDHRRLSELLQLWFELHGKNLKSGAHALRRMEIACEELNDPIAVSITGKDFAHYRAKRRTKGRGETRNGTELAPSSHNYDLLWFRAVFNELTRLKEWCQPNPLADVRPIKTSENELAYLSVEQMAHLFDAVADSPVAEQITKIIKICLATGARIMEAVELKGTQVSKHKITYINTKGKKNRTVPISEELFDEIYQPTTGRLFTCGYGVVYKWLTRALPDLPKGQATHVLRHTFGSHFMTNGGNIIVLQRILGHSDISQTMVYAHFAPNHLSDAVAFNPLNSLKHADFNGDKVAAAGGK